MKITIDKQRITWRKLRDELVLMHLDTGAYYSLNETGVLIWQGLTEGRDPLDIVADLTDMYDVDEAVARQDVENLINELADQGLIELNE